MLLRFSIYGILRNQRYYDPFMILAFREKGLSFFQIGILIGFREVCINLMEVPIGAVADLWGRRRSMIFSFLSFIASFLVFGLSTSFAALFAAMFAFAVGDAFRSGTHKAMIFDWLRSQGLEAERTRYYGLTRSWARLGMAASVLISAGFIYTGSSYSYIFLLTAIPYAAAIVNFFGYPASLDGPKRADVSPRAMAAHLWKAFRRITVHPPLRRLLGESMGFSGLYKISKDYIQPVLKQAAVGLAVLSAMEGNQRVAVLIGAVYFVLHLLSSAASLGAHRLAGRLGSEERAAAFLWNASLVLYAGLGAGLWYGWREVVIGGFLALALLQNFWRPIQLSRFNAHADAEAGATVLSIESQARSLFGMVAAPLLGLAVDRLGLWSVGAAGALVCLPFAAGALLGRTEAGLRPIDDRA